MVSTIALDPNTGHSVVFACPWCQKPLRLWRERFKGSGKVHVRTAHVDTSSDNCHADPVGALTKRIRDQQHTDDDAEPSVVTCPSLRVPGPGREWDI